MRWIDNQQESDPILLAGQINETKKKKRLWSESTIQELNMTALVFPTASPSIQFGKVICHGRISRRKVLRL